MGHWNELEVAMADAVAADSFLSKGVDFFVCGHPAVLCVVLAAMTTPRPMLIYLQSTLLYGAPGCGSCDQEGHTLRYFESFEAHAYLSKFQMVANTSAMAILANCPFASAQVWYQVGVVVPSVPNQALY